MLVGDHIAETAVRRTRTLAISILLEDLLSLFRPEDWHLKGSCAIWAWLGGQSRLPEDVDICLAQSALADLEGSYRATQDTERGVRLVRTQRVRFTPGREKPPVYRYLFQVGGPTIDLVLANVLVEDDLSVRSDDRVGSIQIPACSMPLPAVRITRCLAQKLLRYTLRRSGSRVNTKWVDLFDFCMIIECAQAPRISMSELREDVQKEFANVGRTTPVLLPPPPVEWLDYWDTNQFVEGTSFGDLSEAESRARSFWEPVFSNDVANHSEWSPTEQRWSG